jgi:ferric iron reductase protein FhuF
MDPEPMTDAQLLEALAPLSVRATLDPPAQARAEGSSIEAPGDAAALIDNVEHGLFASPISLPSDLAVERRREVAASVAFQAVVGQVANPVVLAAEVLGVGIDVQLADVRWRADGWAVRYGLTEIRRRPVRPRPELIYRLHAHLVRPLAATIRASVALPERLLDGNAEAAIRTATDAAGRALGVPGDPPLTRTTCCLIHLAGLAACTECPLEGPAG